LTHWGVVEYILVATVWLIFSIPLFLAGWGAVSLLGFPLFLLSIALLASLVKSRSEPLEVPPAQPRLGFPSELVVPQLGPFPLSTYSNERYEQAITWCGMPTCLSLSVEELSSIGAVLRAAESLVRSSLRVNSEVQAYATSQLLAGINEERKATEALDAETFLRAITLEMITVHADNTYEFLYRDGELLGGHWIEVHGELEGGPISIDTPG